MTPGTRRRLVLAGLLLGVVAVFGVARWLEPDPRGYGTHEALSLPPCGMMFLTDIPCPSCGMTTSFAHAARLEVAGSFRAHPFGLILFGSMIVTGLLSSAGLVGGLSPERLERWFSAFPWGKAVIVYVGLFFLFWGYRVWEAFQGGA